MSFVPLRSVFRSRWSALIWASGICLTAVNFAGGDAPTLDAANSTDGALAQASALLAED